MNWDFTLTSLAVAILGSFWLARSRGASGLLYGSLGLLLGLGALPITWLSTRERREAGGGVGFTPFEANPEQGLKGSAEALADLDTWSRLYFAIRRGLVLSLVVILAVFLGACGLATSYLLPTFVVLFEGMSLALPVPTQILVATTKLLRHPMGIAFFSAVKLIAPVLFYQLLLGLGYWVPFLGPIWRHTDRIWQIHARRTGCREIVPPEVARRGKGTLVDWPEDDAGLRGMLARDREELSIALWLALPLWIPAVALGVFFSGVVMVAVCLPFYTHVGNIGG